MATISQKKRKEWAGNLPRKIEIGDVMVVTKGHFINRAGRLTSLGKIGCSVLLDGDVIPTFFWNNEIRLESEDS